MNRRAKRIWGRSSLWQPLTWEVSLCPFINQASIVEFLCCSPMNFKYLVFSLRVCIQDGGEKKKQLILEQYKLELGESTYK